MPHVECYFDIRFAVFLFLHFEGVPIGLSSSIKIIILGNFMFMNGVRLMLG